MNRPFLPTAATALCDPKGRLNPDAVGWSQQPLIDCRLPGNTWRRKRWNHWCIITPDWTLSLLQADLDYAGYGAAYFADLHTGQSVSYSQLNLLARGCSLPDTPEGSHAFEHPDLKLHFNEHPGRVRLTALGASIDGRSLQLALDIQRPAHLGSVNLVAPLGGNCFHATCRQVGLPASGSVQWGDREYTCRPGQSFASMDFGRGVWPYRSHWTRAAFAAPGGIAGNFGSGWTDHSGLSENALWFGGDLQHLDQPVHIRQEHDQLLSPWQVRSDDERVDLHFVPRYRYAVKPRLGLFYNHIQLWFGHYHGMLLGPAGERVPVSGADGWLGNAKAFW